MKILENNFSDWFLMISLVGYMRFVILVIRKKLSVFVFLFRWNKWDG